MVVTHVRTSPSKKTTTPVNLSCCAVWCKCKHNFEIPTLNVLNHVYSPERFYTCDSPQPSNGSDDGQIGVCQEVSTETSFIKRVTQLNVFKSPSLFLVWTSVV